MSYSSLVAQSQDLAFTGRVQAAVIKEVYANPTFANTDYGRSVLASPSNTSVMDWPVSIDTEAAYESALVAGNPNPGGDPAVVTDAMILFAVQAHWPPDAEPTP